MYRVIDSRGTGKTRKLLTECAANNGLFVTHHPASAIEKCAAYGLMPVQVMGYYEFLQGHARGINKPVYIDEVEYFIQDVVRSSGGKDLAGYTLNKED